MRSTRVAESDVFWWVPFPVAAVFRHGLTLTSEIGSTSLFNFGFKECTYVQLINIGTYI